MKKYVSMYTYIEVTILNSIEYNAPLQTTTATIAIFLFS